MQLAEKYKFLDVLSINLCAEGYSLKISSWNRQQPIDALIAEIETRGPLAVGGFFGPGYYQTPASDVDEKIAGRNVYGWPAGDRSSVEGRNRHIILLIGAKKTAKFEVVFYINPNDESDPENPQIQRIYAMSYKRLTSDALSIYVTPKLAWPIISSP